MVIGQAALVMRGLVLKENNPPVCSMLSENYGKTVHILLQTILVVCICIFGLAIRMGAIYIFLETRRQNLIDIIMVFLIALFIFVLGAFCLVIPLTSKVILTSEGIQYCTIGGIVKARWSDVTVRFFKDQTGENVALHVSKYEMILRAWTRYVPWDTQKGATYNLKHHGIPISQFGGFSPHKLVADIRSLAHL